jgi:cbb3-type cytochrome oxidase subunit 3
LSDSPHGFTVMVVIILVFTVAAVWYAFRKKD